MTEPLTPLRLGQPLELPADPNALSVRGFLDTEHSGFAPLGDLNHDGDADDRTDLALRARHDAYSQADALNWLLEGSPTTKTQEPTAPADKPQASFLQTAMEGFSEPPRQALGGVRDAAQSFLEFAEWTGRQAEKNFPLGGVQVFDEQGNFSPGYIPPQVLAEGRKRGKIRNPELPDVGQPQTAAGSVVRGVTQFMVPYGR